MLVKSLLVGKSSHMVTAKPSTSIDEAMELLISHNIGCLLIVDDDNKLVGIVSDKDIFKKIHRTGGDYHSLIVADIMSAKLVVGIPDDIIYIVGLMKKHLIQHVPIVENENIVGVVSRRDINDTIIRSDEVENHR